MEARISFCSFNKFVFCKFGRKCTKMIYSEICEQILCENDKFYKNDILEDVIFIVLMDFGNLEMIAV